MKKTIMIYGTGRSAHTVADYIGKQFGEIMEVRGFYCLDKSGYNLNDGSYVSSLNELLGDTDVAVDAFVIPNPGKQIDVVIEAHKIVKESKCLLVSAASLRNPNKNDYFIEIDVNKPWLSGFEYHVSDYCNLDCKGCGHCSNLFDKQKLPELSSYEKDLRRLYELYDGIGLIRLLGGEPLLNEKLDEFVKVTRKYFNSAELHIVTNGILIPTMPEKLIQAIRENFVIIDISVYPPMVNKLNKITDVLKQNEIEFNIMPVEKFYKRFCIEKKFDKYEAFASCRTATCHALFDGKIALCIVPFSTQVLNENFGCKVEIDGWIDIHEHNISGQEINQRLREPIELCAHCNPEKYFYEWESRKKEACVLDDWICDNI